MFEIRQCFRHSSFSMWGLHVCCAPVRTATLPRASHFRPECKFCCVDLVTSVVASNQIVVWVLVHEMCTSDACAVSMSCRHTNDRRQTFRRLNAQNASWETCSARVRVQLVCSFILVSDKYTPIYPPTHKHTYLHVSVRAMPRTCKCQGLCTGSRRRNTMLSKQCLLLPDLMLINHVFIKRMFQQVNSNTKHQPAKRTLCVLGGFFLFLQYMYAVGLAIYLMCQLSLQEVFII